MTRFAGQALAAKEFSTASLLPLAAKRSLPLDEYAAAVASSDQRIPRSLRHAARTISSQAQTFDLLDPVE